MEGFPEEIKKLWIGTAVVGAIVGASLGMARPNKKLADKTADSLLLGMSGALIAPLTLTLSPIILPAYLLSKIIPERWYVDV